MNEMQKVTDSQRLRGRWHGEPAGRGYAETEVTGSRCLLPPTTCAVRTGALLYSPTQGVPAQCLCGGAQVCRMTTLRFSTGSGACAAPLGKLLLDTALAVAAREEAEYHGTEPPRYRGSSLPGASSAPWAMLTPWHRAASVLSAEGQPMQPVLIPCAV